MFIFIWSEIKTNQPHKTYPFLVPIEYNLESANQNCKDKLIFNMFLSNKLMLHFTACCNNAFLSLVFISIAKLLAYCSGAQKCFSVYLIFALLASFLVLFITLLLVYVMYCRNLTKGHLVVLWFILKLILTISFIQKYSFRGLKLGFTYFVKHIKEYQK